MEQAFPACILFGRNYNKVVRICSSFHTPFPRLTHGSTFCSAAWERYCFVFVTTSHSRIPELSSTPPMDLGYQQERRSSL